MKNEEPNWKNKMEISPIGIVKNDEDTEILKYSKGDLELDLDGAIKDRQAPNRSRIIINEEFAECLDGIDDFSHLIIIFWTHNTPEESRKMKKIHPAGLRDMPIKGIFATRSPARPNPICKTTVKLIERTKNILLVEDFDAINNTPVLDIKPFIPSYDSAENVIISDWMQKLMDDFVTLDKHDPNKS